MRVEGVVTAKAALRRAVQARIAGVDTAWRASASAAVVGHLTPMLPAGGDVLAYVALPDEVDLAPLLAGLAAGGRLLLPRVGPAGLTIHRVTDLAAGLALGTYGIREPTTPAVDHPAPVVILVPGRAFDAVGGRLGRGGGYYDRLLPGLAGATRVGVGWSIQRVGQVPRDAHDAAMDAIVDETGLRWVPPSAHGGTAPHTP